MSIRNEARAFRIWREGHSVDWECSIAELAKATGINRSTVSRICRKRGWPVQQGKRDYDVKQDIVRKMREHTRGLEVVGFKRVKIKTPSKTKGRRYAL